MIQFAGRALPLIRSLLKESLPGKGELAMSVVPNLAYAGLTAATLPGRQVGPDGEVLYEGASAGLRAGALAEDLIGSLGVGFGARVLARGGIRGIERNRMRAGKEPFTHERRAMIQNIAENVAEPAAYMTGMMPRPFANQAFTDYQTAMDSASQADRQQQALEEQRRQMAVLERSGGLGLAIDPVQQLLMSYGLG